MQSAIKILFEKHVRLNEKLCSNCRGFERRQYSVKEHTLRFFFQTRRKSFRLESPQYASSKTQMCAALWARCS